MTLRCPEVPKGFRSWNQILQVRELQRMLEQQMRYSADASNARTPWPNCEIDFLALKDLRPEESL